MDLYLVNVSSLEVRAEPDIPSKVFIKRDTIVELTGDSMKFQSRVWVKIQTKSYPTISGYVPKRFLKKV